mgnify:CR=1 FL=1|tara:strand:+ start:85 stop:582 length:498 start_codon:yes stop_codon:yes gene_type:complete
MELRNRTLPEPVIKNIIKTQHTKFKLEPYIAVIKDSVVNINKVDKNRIKEIIYCHWDNEMFSAYLCFRYPMTEHGYSKTREILEKVNRKGCKHVEVSSFNLACDISSYGYKAEYNQYIERFYYPNYNDLEDLEDIKSDKKTECYLYTDYDHFNKPHKYMLRCNYE